jgi:prepilin-type N-terminal cleavage/methylation domain-containing protein
MNWRSEDGYSMMELLVVLGIAGLVFALAAPLLPRAGMATSPAGRAASAIAELATLRERAIAERKSIAVRVGEGAKPGDAVATLNTAGVEWRAASIGPGREQSDLTFFPDGTMSAGAVLISDGGQWIVVVARPWSGRFEVQSGHEKR